MQLRSSFIIIDIRTVGKNYTALIRDRNQSEATGSDALLADMQQSPAVRRTCA